MLKTQKPDQKMKESSWDHDHDIIPAKEKNFSQSNEEKAILPQREARSSSNAMDLWNKRLTSDDLTEEQPPTDQKRLSEEKDAT